MHPWVPVIVTIGLGLAGLGVQGLLLAFFLGRMKAHHRSSATRMCSVASTWATPARQAS